MSRGSAPLTNGRLLHILSLCPPPEGRRGAAATALLFGGSSSEQSQGPTVGYVCGQKGNAVSVIPFFRVSLRLATDQPGQPFRKWSNTFYVEAANPVAAAAAGVGAWTGFLRGAARERVYCYQVYATDLLANTDNYQVQNVDQAFQRGSLATPGTEPYQPKTCLSVTIPVDQSRPSRKFWRPGLYEGDVSNGVTINSTLADTIADAFNNLIANSEGLWLDPDRQQWLAPVQLRLTTREFGREATADVPIPPPLG